MAGAPEPQWVLLFIAVFTLEDERYLCSVQTAEFSRLAGCPSFQKVKVAGGCRKVKT
jgi:hypothetical protein